MGLLSLIAKLGMDTAGFDSGVKHAENMATQMQRRIGNMFATRSTVNFSKMPASAQKDYADWWSGALAKREQAETESSIRAATRSNRARTLLRQRAERRETRIADELSGGSIPEAWRRVKREWTAANTETQTSWRKWGGEAGRQIARISRTFVAAFAFREVLQSIKAVADALEELDKKKYNISGYSTQERKRSTGELSAQERENVTLGQVGASRTGDRFNRFLGKGAGLYSFLGGTISETVGDAWKRKDAASLLFGWGRGSQRAAAKQTDEMQSIIAFSGAEADREAADKAAEEAEKQRARELADEEKIFQLRLKRMNVDERIFSIRLRLRGASGVDREELLNQLSEAQRERAEKRKKPAIERDREAMSVFDPLRRIGALNQSGDVGFRLVSIQERIARATEQTANNTSGGIL